MDLEERSGGQNQDADCEPHEEGGAIQCEDLQRRRARGLQRGHLRNTFLAIATCSSVIFGNLYLSVGLSHNAIFLNS